MQWHIVKGDFNKLIIKIMIENNNPPLLRELRFIAGVDEVG